MFSAQLRIIYGVFMDILWRFYVISIGLDLAWPFAPPTPAVASRRSGRRTRHHSARLTNPRGGRNLGRPRPPGKQPTHNDWARGRVSAKRMSTVLVSHHRTTFVRPLQASTSTTCPVLQHASAPSRDRRTALGHDQSGRTRVAVWRLGECRRPDGRGVLGESVRAPTRPNVTLNAR